MPYKTNRSLPGPVKALPKHGQDIYRNAFNAANEQYKDENRAHATAWAAVKNKYRKAGDRWVEKSMTTIVLKHLATPIAPTMIIKSEAEEKRIVYGVVMEPEVVDAHGDIVGEDEIEKAAHAYMMKSQTIGVQHSKIAKSVYPIESYIAPTDIEGIKKGSWVMAVKVADDEIWKSIKDGSITGFSIGGYGLRI